MIRLSAFADEISQDPREQVDVLTRHGIKHIEFRAIHGANVLDAIDEALYRHGIPPDHVRHLLFTFSGNAPEALLTQALQAYPGPIGQWGVGLHVDGHAAFVGAVYAQVIANANQP